MVVVTGGTVVVVCGDGGSVVTGGAVGVVAVVVGSDTGVHAATNTTTDRPTNQMKRFIGLEHTATSPDSRHRAPVAGNRLTTR